MRKSSVSSPRDGRVRQLHFGLNAAQRGFREGALTGTKNDYPNKKFVMLVLFGMHGRISLPTASMAAGADAHGPWSHRIQPPTISDERYDPAEAILGVTHCGLTDNSAMLAWSTTEGAHIYSDFLSVGGSVESRDIGGHHRLFSASKPF